MIRKIIYYLKSHLWYTISLVFGLAMVCMYLGYQQYMQYKYADFLLEKNHLMESAVLENVHTNLYSTLNDYIDMGSQIAVNPVIYQSAEEVFFSESNDEKTKGIRDLNNNLSTMAALSGKVLNISLVTEDGQIFQYDRMVQGKKYSMWGEEDMEGLKEQYEKLYEKATGPQVPRYLVATSPTLHPNHERVFHIFYPMVGKSSSFTQMNSMLCITYKMDILQPFLDTIAKSESAYTKGYITDESGTIIYHSDSVYIGKKESQYLSTSSIITLDQSLENTGWKLHIALDKFALNRSVGGILKQGMFVFCILLAALAALFYQLMRRISKPLGKIQTAMIRTGSEKGYRRILIEGEHEIWQLAEKYNEMTENLELKEQEVERNHQLTLISLERQHQAEWEALETQINAHFLCNTLGTINYEAIECGNFKVSRLIKNLSNILRYTFDQKSQKVYMSQEIAWIEQYLYLQKARLEDVFDYRITFPEEFCDCPCCKLMLQPFVENAIMHGFEGRESGGLLEISVEKQGKFLRLTIKDNGCGIPEEKCGIIQEMLNGEQLNSVENFGIGIRNVASRMRLFYGGKAKMSVKSYVGQGTVFTFIVPCSQETEGFSLRR